MLERVGSIVEAPAMYPNFSARRNLDLPACIYRIGARRVDAVLETVGLTDRQKDTTKGSSLRR